METTREINTGTFIHLSTLSQFFIPFGNFIFPIIIWTSKKDKSEFIDYNGKQVINFQLSIMLYTLVLAMIAIPIFILAVFNNIPFHSIVNNHDIIFECINNKNIIGIAIVALISILIFISLKVAEFLLIIYASLKTANGEKYKYPLSISFIK
ncbi:DUF4870 domain-containing protein [Flavobacterium cellulosilyticum]|uniref:DUF4870 domain-containing protein n=1 Tax=Flavobacterium cellulosilyticum TaxID=2541731 RepID=A0A4R5CCU9_9FLAO|nr:DUF4870 domain-containing protein [Flavobacterium cellulosilyticum]TDD97285.1 DUF4870 domain-containing protein [Flavobacterium cellulosilyticum]